LKNTTAARAAVFLLQRKGLQILSATAQADSVFTGLMMRPCLRAIQRGIAAHHKKKLLMNKNTVFAFARLCMYNGNCIKAFEKSPMRICRIG